MPTVEKVEKGTDVLDKVQETHLGDVMDTGESVSQLSTRDLITQRDHGALDVYNPASWVRSCSPNFDGFWMQNAHNAPAPPRRHQNRRALTLQGSKSLNERHRWQELEVVSSATSAWTGISVMKRWQRGSGLNAVRDFFSLRWWDGDWCGCCW